MTIYDVDKFTWMKSIMTSLTIVFQSAKFAQKCVQVIACRSTSPKSRNVSP